MFFKVSIIVLMHNVTQYVEKCLRTVFEQDMDRLQFILINDYSTDDTMEKVDTIVKDYPELSMEIVNLSRNVGSAAARNEGLKRVVGEYFIFLDGDDWIEKDEVSSLYKVACEGHFDVVYCDFMEEFADRTNIVKQVPVSDGVAMIESMMNGKNHGATWNKLVRTEIIKQHKLRFVPSWDLYEDVCFNVKLAAYTDSFHYLPKSFYHYRCGLQQSIVGSSLGCKRRSRALERCYNIGSACDYLQHLGKLEGVVKKESLLWKLYAKGDLLDDNLYSCKRWMTLFPEANVMIWGAKKYSLNYRILLSWLCWKKPRIYLLHKYILSLLSKV